jgi:Fe/S biogenesis protein NfuA
MEGTSLQELFSKLERILDEQVRPDLRTHGGDMEVLSLEGGVMRFRLLGHCSGCPSAYLTTEQLVKKQVMDAIPEISDVMLVTQINDGLMETARLLLRKRNGA